MAYPTKTASQIIDTFELQVNDVTELSTSEELSVLNRVYQRICSSRPWEFLKKVASGTMSSDSDGYYITIPNDFAYLLENANYTDNTMEYQNNASPKVIFIGTDYQPYQIVNFSDRRQYRNTSGIAYFDFANSQIRFPSTPVSTTYEFDYYAVPSELTISDTPVFPGRFHDMLAYGMAVENDILQLSEKARSYQPENNAKFQEDLKNMAYWNAQLYNG